MRSRWLSSPFLRIPHASGHRWGPFLFLPSVCGAQVSRELITGEIWSRGQQRCRSSQELCFQKSYSLMGHGNYTRKTEGWGGGSVERQIILRLLQTSQAFCLQFWSWTRLPSVTWVSTPESWVKEVGCKDTEGLWKAEVRIQQSFQVDFLFVMWKLSNRKWQTG